MYTKVKHGHTLEISYDQDPANPREWDNLGALRIHTRNFEIHEELPNPDMHTLLTFTVYAYIHGGLALSLDPFTCPWDSGPVGQYHVLRKDIISEFFPTEQGIPTDEALIRRAKERIQSELKDLTAYFNCDVYGYEITSNYSQEVVDSCWGYYDLEHCKQDGEQALNDVKPEPQPGDEYRGFQVTGPVFRATSPHPTYPKIEADSPKALAKAIDLWHDKADAVLHNRIQNELKQIGVARHD